MNDSEDAIFNNLTPISSDFRELEQIYNHKDNETTVSGASVTGESFVTPTSLPSAPSEDGASETVTVQKLDDGRTVVTFITWGIYDTTYSVALMHTGLALPFTILITSSIFVSVPRELEEAARTLGCTPLGAFVKVVLPLALPGLAAAAIFTFVLSWNEVFAAVILTLRQRTLPALVLAALNTSPLPFRFAAAWFMLAPSLVVIFVIRRYLLGLWGRVAR